MLKRNAPSNLSRKKSKTTYKKTSEKTTNLPLTKRMNSNFTGFPRMMKMTHRYVETVLISSAGATTTNQFACNGMFDPNLSGVGTQPLYFDNMTAIYDHYTVINSTMKVTFVPELATAQVPILCIFFVNDDTSTVSTNVDTLVQQKGAQFVHIGGPNGSKGSLTQTWSASKYFGGDLLANNSLQGTSSANPSELSVFQIACRANDGVTTVTLRAIIEISYETWWAELKDQAAS